MYLALAYSGGVMYEPGYLSVRLSNGVTSPFTSGVYADPALAVMAISQEIERQEGIDKSRFDPFYFVPTYTVLDPILLISKYTAIPTTAADLVALGTKLGKGKFMVWSGDTLAIIDVSPAIRPAMIVPADRNVCHSLRVLRTNDAGLPASTPLATASSPDINPVAVLWADWVRLIDEGVE